MQMDGQEFLTAVKEEAFEKWTVTAADEAAVNLDDLFKFFDQQLQADKLAQGEIVIDAPEPEDAISLRLETSAINLPLRYFNAMNKLIDENVANEINVYMIVESKLVSQSGLFIYLAASVSAYLDDADSVKAKIAAFFNEKLALINAGGWETLIPEPVDEAEPAAVDEDTTTEKTDK